MREIVGRLIDVLGEDGVLTGQDVRARKSGVFSAASLSAKAIIRPKTTEEVSQSLSLCNEAGQTVVTHGGLTGVVRGTRSREQDVVISLERMNVIEEINPIDRTATVQCGVILQTLQEEVEGHGLMYPLDLGGRGSCTIGGNIATNAGGNRVIRFGMTRDMILGIEAVLADGTIVSAMNQMIKNNTGYDLKQIFIGSEGTLGVVTRAVLRLRELPRLRSTMMMATDDFEKLPAVLKYFDSALGGTLSAFEVMWNNFYRLVTTAPAKNVAPMPRDYPFYVLVEAMGADEGAVEAIMAELWNQGLLVDAIVAKSEAQRRQLWAVRDDVGQVTRFKPSFSFDVSLRISTMVDYVNEVNARLERRFPAVQNFTLGHLGDGNLHFLIATHEGDSTTRKDVEACVYEPLVQIHGSVSAEHGVGLEKKPYLKLCRSPSEIDMMRRIKVALDPAGILNPGKIFDI